MSVNEPPAPPVRRRPSRRVILRRRAVLFSTSALVIALGIYLPLTLLAPLGSTAPRVLPYSAPDRIAASPELPSYGASAVGVIGYPEASASAGSTSPLPIASISKIVTSLVVLEAKPLSPGDSGPTITFTAADAALRAKYVALNGETKPLAAGSTISQLDLMRVTLVASANNYADALTGWAFGSRGAFQIAVTAWLGSHGLDHTTIVEPTGINPGNVSTAADLVEIGKLALANPVISQIVSTPSMTQAGVGTFANTNTLLGRLGVDGIKTGTLNGSSNLLFAARYEYAGHSVTVVGAVVGATDHKTVDATVTTLLAGVKAGFHVITLAKKGQPFANFTTAWSQKVRAVSTKTASVLVWSNTPVTAVIAAFPATVGQRAGSAGTVTFTAGRQSVRVPLTLDRRLVDPGPLWRLGNPTLLLP
ncbi:D-alanyl-D-alanine carboxypeptidase [Glaciihabitans sp. INWT7]|uniref:D-alanyl-D-alanine carboxypeptidase family protein n=1 Tax=Glaciihabitans sp. INWT7 TaxID=2596912 RepID=UPI001627B92E|nr:D-alanyl-D-alanine carboxypeptidase [Glaciihabitans sp. INWT7]QNE46793.1 D-alanyl-D-alanine carboxypeptidase [Glaciihabitans sp. INWT7]